MLTFLENYLGKWIGWREFGRYFWFGVNLAIGAALGVGIFYSLCVMILLLEPTL